MQLNTFNERHQLDTQLANTVADLLTQAIKAKGKASIAVSGGSTPKGFFHALSNKSLAWDKITITLADERWVALDDEASNTRLVFENLLQNKAINAKFFHLKQGDDLNEENLHSLDVAANSVILPFDVLILGMGEDGHTASLFPCSEQIAQALALNNPNALMKVVPKTAPHERITFTLACLLKSKSIFLHLAGASKKRVLEVALNGTDEKVMPIRAFLQHSHINTHVFWAE